MHDVTQAFALLTNIVPELDFPASVALFILRGVRLIGIDSLKRYFDRHIHGTEDIPLEKLLAPFAVAVTNKRENRKPSLGARTVKEGNDCKLVNVYEGGAAHRAGLSALDLLVAIDGLRVSAGNLGALMSRYCVDDTVPSMHSGATN